MDEKCHFEASSQAERESHVWASIAKVRDWLGANPRRTKLEYSIGVHNDDGDCYDVAIKQKGRPIATLIAPEADVQRLVHAGNCYAALERALRAVDRAIIEVADVMHYENDLPVTFLESSDIERAYYALTHLMPEVKRAIALCRFGCNAMRKAPGDGHV
jgi:hypothetical protein